MTYQPSAVFYQKARHLVEDDLIVPLCLVFADEGHSHEASKVDSQHVSRWLFRAMWLHFTLYVATDVHLRHQGGSFYQPMVAPQICLQCMLHRPDPAILDRG